MQTREIPHEQWQPFFDDFTKLHQDERVNVESIGESGSDVRTKLCGLPLVGIFAAHAKSGREEWIELIARDAADATATHVIVRPSRVRLAEEGGRAIALQVEAADGAITIIRFEPPRENMPEGFTVA